MSTTFFMRRAAARTFSSLAGPQTPHLCRICLPNIFQPHHHPNSSSSQQLQQPQQQYPTTPLTKQALALYSTSSTVSRTPARPRTPTPSSAALGSTWVSASMSLRYYSTDPETDPAEADAGITSEPAAQQEEAADTTEPSTAGAPADVATKGAASQKRTTVYVGNLFFDVTADALSKLFEQFGTVSNAKIIYDARGLSKGFGYIDFARDEDAKAAMEALDGEVFEGRRMTVQKPLATAPPRTRGRFGDDTFKSPPSPTLFIGNLSFEMTDKDLNDMFRGIKNVVDVRVAIDRRTGMPRGFAHADFIDEASAAAAREELLQKEFYGRKVRVDYSTNSKVNARRAEGAQ